MTLRPRVDRHRCVGAGTCITIAPTAFDWYKGDFAKAGVLDAASVDDEVLREAALACPTGAITIEDVEELLPWQLRGKEGPRRVEKTFMFTDIESSTNLVEALGDEVWQGVLRWHNEALRSLFAEHKGEEVVSTGDGFFVGFDSPDEALACAVAIQRRLAEHRRSAGFAPKVRIGLHASGATQVGRDFSGKGVHEAARIAALADGDQIVASRATAADGRYPDLGAADRDPAGHVRTDGDRDGRLGVSGEYDLVVIGGGPAGERGAAQAAYFGKRVAIVERQPEPGGAAVHTGTLPSKTLRETALFLSGYRQRQLDGVLVDLDPELTVTRLLDRKDAVRHLEVDRIHTNLERHGIDLMRGEGRVVDPHTVEVGSADGAARLSAEVILIATGSSPYRPAGIPYGDDDVHDADGILRINRLPRSMAVIGGGVIGCEYACMFAALGVQVHLIDPRPGLLPFLDLEMGERLADAMGSLGVALHLERTFEEVARGPGGLTCTLSSGEPLVVETVMVAAGRQGNTDGLGLPTIGVEVDARGNVKVDEDFRTAVPSIYAAGDVVGFPALASVSMEQGRVAVCHAFGFTYKRQVSDVLPYGVYTIPEVSCVGLGEEEAARRGIDVVAGRAFYRDNVRGQIMNDRDGMVKLVFDRSSRRLIGCHCIGERASELVHVGQAIIVLDGTVETFIEMVFNHPTLGETFKYAAYDALAQLGPAPSVAT